MYFLLFIKFFANSLKLTAIVKRHRVIISKKIIVMIFAFTRAFWNKTKCIRDDMCLCKKLTYAVTRRQIQHFNFFISIYSILLPRRLPWRWKILMYALEVEMCSLHNATSGNWHNKKTSHLNNKRTFFLKRNTRHFPLSL